MTQRLWICTLTCLAGLLGLPPAARAAEESKTAKIAHIKLSGGLDEAPVAVDPIFNMGMENFAKKLERIKKARDDKDVTALYLQFDGLELGWGKLDELRRAIQDVRKTGKKVYAFLEAGEPDDYFAALACDEICMPESGTLMLVGLRAEMTFFKKLLENLNLQADVLQEGDFKAAGEPFVRTEPSPENRKQFELVFDDLFDKSYVQPIADFRKGKGWTAEQVRKLIDQGPFTAKKAKDLGLLDRIAYGESFRDAIKEQLKVDKLTVLANYGQTRGEELDFSNPFAVMMKLFKPPQASLSLKPKVAVIYAVGPIITGKGGEGLFGGSMVGSSDMIKAIRQAEQDKTVKAIVMRVDSPGGSALASDLIWNELKQCKKPVVASMSDVAASGGYYIAMPAKKIFAEPGTITGSIGVIGMKLVTGKMEDRVGINTTIISRGANSGILSSSAPFTDSERKAMKEVMGDIYDQFLNKALAGRKEAGKAMTLDQLKNLAGGRIWTGRQAKANGLIDELGTLEDAIVAAKELAGFKGDTDILVLPKPKSFLDSLIEGGMDSKLASRLSVLREVPGMERHLPLLEALIHLKRERVLAIAPYRFDVK